jgi:hypothetical protein
VQAWVCGAGLAAPIAESRHALRLTLVLSFTIALIVSPTPLGPEPLNPHFGGFTSVI